MTGGLETKFLKTKTKHDNVSRRQMLRDPLFPMKYDFHDIFENWLFKIFYFHIKKI